MKVSHAGLFAVLQEIDRRLQNDEPITRRVLAESVHYSPRYITAAIAALEEQGLLTRQAPNSDYPYQVNHRD